MKRSFLAICFGGLFFAGCKEVPPDINFGNSRATDTTYVGPVPATTDPHNVLVEEFTGESCVNCPQGHAVLDSAEVHNPGRVNVIALFEADGSLDTQPPSGAAYDFRSNTAKAIANSAIYNGVNQLPSGGIDRVPVSGTTVIGYSSWAGDITGRLSTPDSLNLGISSTYNAASNTATIIATITYTQAVSTAQNLSIVVVQDSIIDYQAFPLGKTDSTYLFNDVFLGMVTTVPFGDPVLDTIPTKVAGRFLQTVYSYKLPAFAQGAVNPANCRVIAFVNAPGTTGDYRIMQSAQTKLMGP